MRAKLEARLKGKQNELQKLATEIDNANRAIQQAQVQNTARVAEAQRLQGAIGELESIIKTLPEDATS